MAHSGDLAIVDPRAKTVWRRQKLHTPADRNSMSWHLTACLIRRMGYRFNGGTCLQKGVASSCSRTLRLSWLHQTSFLSLAFRRTDKSSTSTPACADRQKKKRTDLASNCAGPDISTPSISKMLPGRLARTIKNHAEIRIMHAGWSASHAG